MSTKIKCLILDDEIPGLTYLKMLCEQFPEVTVVKAFDNSSIFLNEVDTLDFNTCILDIEMGGMNGLQVANILKGKAIIFVTAYREYAVDAFELNAVDYICKPIQRDRLKQAIDKVIDKLNGNRLQNEFVQLNSEKGKILLYFDRISYIIVSESDSRDKVVYMTDGRASLLKNISFDKLDKILPPNMFCRINKKEIIAFKIVEHFSNDVITSSVRQAGSPILFTLSEVYKSDFLNRISRLS